MIKIFSIDDDDDFLDAIDRALQKSLQQNQFDVVGRWGNVEDDDDVLELLETLQMAKPDIILMDIDFSLKNRPHDFGVELTRRIMEMERDFTPKVIVLSSPFDADNEEIAKLKRAFGAGAVGYLSKRHIKTWGECIVEVHTSNFALNEAAHLISDREKEVIFYLSRDFLGNEVHTQMKDISNSGVQFHINNLRSKFEVRTLHGIVSTAFRIRLLH